MEKRLRTGLLLIGIALLLEVISGFLGLITFILGRYVSGLFVMACFYQLIGGAAIILIIIGFIMILTRKKLLGKDGRYVTLAIIAMVVFVILFIVIFILSAIFMFSLNPRHYTYSLIGEGLISSILGTLVVFLIIYPLLSDSLKRKIRYCFVIIVVLTVLVQPFVFIGLKDLEDDFDREFEGREFTNDEKANEALITEIQSWLMNSSGTEEVEALTVYNSITLIPLAYIAFQVFMYVRAQKKDQPPKRKPGYPVISDTGEGVTPPGDDRDVCKYCGAPLIPDIDFCPNCGAYLKD